MRKLTEKDTEKVEQSAEKGAKLAEKLGLKGWAGLAVTIGAAGLAIVYLMFCTGCGEVRGLSISHPGYGEIIFYPANKVQEGK